MSEPYCKMNDEAFCKEISSNIKDAFETYGRVDERLKNLSEEQQYIENKFEQIINSQNDIIKKITQIEISGGQEAQTHIQKSDVIIEDIKKDINQLKLGLSNVERLANNSEDRWKNILDFVLKALGTLLLCYLIYELKLQSPPLP